MSCPVWMTCLSPFGQFEVGVLGQVWDTVRNDETSLVEGWKGKSSRLRWVCWFGFTEKAATDCFIDTETVHGPAKERICPQGQVGHQALCSKDPRQEEQRGSIMLVSHQSFHTG